MTSYDQESVLLPHFLFIQELIKSGNNDLSKLLCLTKMIQQNNFFFEIDHK